MLDFFTHILSLEVEYMYEESRFKSILYVAGTIVFNVNLKRGNFIKHLDDNRYNLK